MIKIKLVCCVGMSTSILVNRMKKVAADRGLETEISATSETELVNDWAKNPADVVLLGPQVRYMQKKIEERVNHSVPIGLIEMRTYGLMDGAKVLDQALKLYEEYYNK